MGENMQHLHAIAPGMYCTNTQCSMRINIDLSECVDCEYDFIENAVYAESSRMDAMRNVEFLKENNELNSSSATKYFMQVKAAEAIMDDFDAIYVEPGTPVIIHVSEEIWIDYDPEGRRVQHQENFNHIPVRTLD